MNGELQVGRIYKRDGASEADQWLWAINGVQRTGSEVMRVAGIATSLDEAKAELQENWEKWLAWANLREVGDAAPLQPLVAPMATSDRA